MFLMDKAPVWVTVARISGNQHTVGAGLVPALGDHEGRPYGKPVLHIGKAGAPSFCRGDVTPSYDGAAILQSRSAALP